MGAVYRALDETLGRYVAIKVMRRSLAADRQFVENFLREARAAAALSHPNVVQVYSCGEWRGQPYIVMELVDGGRLDEEISRGEPMDEVRALEIALDVAEGLRAAAEIGLVHGDIKPANILFDSHGTAKVADFGLARFARREPESGEVWGTPYYIAPEKARRQKVDHRADIYSLGATLYHALGAKPPFEGETATDVVLARLKNPAIGLRVIRPSLQPETADVVARMLEADPFMRYPTYESLIADLREALRIAKQQSRGGARRTRKQKTNVAVMVFVSAAVAAAIGVALWVGLRPRARRGATQGARGERLPAPSAAQAHTQQVVRAPKEPGGIQSELDPFGTAVVTALQQAVTAVVAGKELAAEEQFERIYRSLPPTSMGRLWIRLFQVMAAVCGRREDSATVYVNEIEGAHLAASETRHPAVLARTAAAYLMGSGNDAWLFIEASRWPPWLRDLAEFVAGMRNLREGDLTAARKHLENYLGRKPGQHNWVYLWQPLARKWMEELDYYERLRDAFREALDQGDLDKASHLLADAGKRLSTFLRPFLAGMRSSLDVARRKKKKEEEKIALRQYQQTVQEDLDVLDQVRVRCLPYVKIHDYESALSELAKVKRRLRTAEGRQAYENLAETYRRMRSIRDLVVARVKESPYRTRSADLGGPVVGATREGLIVAVGTYGQFLRHWNKVPLSVMVEMAEQFATRETDIARRADNVVSLAVFCYMHGWYKAAAKYARTAVGLDPRAAVAARRLMPGILQAG